MAKVLALDRKCERGVTLALDRSNIELPDLVGNWIAIGTRVGALEPKGSQLCENPHLEGEVGIRVDEVRQILGSNWVVFWLSHTAAVLRLTLVRADPRDLPARSP
jgi:hypothetical protein